MQVLLTGKNIELTAPIKSYAEKKISSLDKFYDKIIRADVKLGLTTTKQNNGRIYIVECRLEVPGNDLFASKVEEKDLYKAIDKVKDYLELELKKHKQKTQGRRKAMRADIRQNKEYAVV
ncbi:MAG: ribosomal subunit interface protein [Candidatus Magasanikbacteria bacterium CG10_big_fil_rev_8_21_14_0_10_40_10]|uniref:Ribosomal subunit interface protein n=1 Tax=Candidatus Magasanikbacteria bacterium CG10_big_fil_rev_8_21_14_0_10_40_10 TaxID=1974648 RepID=A0A2M6W4T0_9BACT|nr:MAG: ribosomal subunit interface protein [Candidatus Magasanikbacteria bacterium CG10_big_fil_rev_8_21_14_0_10_40_10]